MSKNKNMMELVHAETVEQVPAGRAVGVWDTEKIEQLCSEIRSAGKPVKIDAVRLWNELRSGDEPIDSLNYNQKYQLKRLFERRGLKAAIRYPYIYIWVE